MEKANEHKIELEMLFNVKSAFDSITARSLKTRNTKKVKAVINNTDTRN